MLISSEKGDAKTLVLSPAFENVSYEEFKELCKLTWQKEEYKDPFYNLIKFKNLKMEGTAADFIAKLYDFGKRLKDDILDNAEFPKYDKDDKENLVEIQHVIDYFAYGLMYENFPESFRNAFKECPTIDPKLGPLKTFSAVKAIVARKQTRIETDTVLYTKSKEKKPADNSSKSKNAGQTTPEVNSNKTKSCPNQQAQQQRPQGTGNAHHNQQYQAYQTGYNYHNQNYRGYQRGHNNYRGRGRGRGRGYYNYNNQYRVVCFKCNSQGHKADTCRSCHYCCSFGHWISDCPVKYKDENSGKNQSGNNKSGAQSGQGQ